MGDAADGDVRCGAAAGSSASGGGVHAEGVGSRAAAAVGQEPARQGSYDRVFFFFALAVLKEQVGR